MSRPVNKVSRRLQFVFIITIGLLAAVSAVPVKAQSGPQRGFYPGGSYSIGDIESINTSNGNMMVRIPLASLPAGRGGSPGFTLTMIYNGKLWDSVQSVIYSDTGGLGGGGGGGINEETETAGPYVREGEPMQGGLQYAYTLNTVVPALNGGWSYGVGYGLQLYRRTDTDSGIACPNTQAMYNFMLKIVFPDGSLHEFRPTGYLDNFGDGYFQVRPDGYIANCSVSGGSVSGDMIYYSTDGSYIRLDVAHVAGNLNQNIWQNNPWTLSFPDGRRVTGGNAPQRMYDRNGNYTEIDQVTNYNGTGQLATVIVDQLGRSIAIYHDPVLQQEDITQTGANGQTLQWAVKWDATDWVYRNYKPTYEVAYQNGPQSVAIGMGGVSEIDLPSQAGSLSYTFGYDGSSTHPTSQTPGWGSLNAITLPSGAHYSYQYWQDNNFTLVDWTTPQSDYPTTKTLTYALEYDCAANSSPTAPCQTSASPATATQTWNYAISSVGGVSTVTSPGGIATTEYFPDPAGASDFAGMSYKSVRADGSVVERIWQYNTPAAPASVKACNASLKTEFTSVKDPVSGNLTLTATKDYTYDGNGNTLTVAEYDWAPYGNVPRNSSGRPTGIPAGATLLRTTVNTYYNSASSSTANLYDSATAPYLRAALASSDTGFGRTEFSYDNPATTGNVTTQTSWDSTKGTKTVPLTAANSISVIHQYDGYGNVVQTTDARGTVGQATYGAINGFTGLYPTQTIAGVGALGPDGSSIARTTNIVYDFNTGLKTSITDQDNGVTSQMTYDAFGRPTLTQAAVGTSVETRTAAEYSDTLRRVISRSDLNTVGDGLIVSIVHYDQLGRVRLARKLEDGSSPYDETTGIKVQTRYSTTGTNTYTLNSNPYRASTSSGASAEATMGWALATADSTGRTVQSQTFGGVMPTPGSGSNIGSTGIVTTAYGANTTTVTDQAGKARSTLVDGLGRLTQVNEDPSGLNYQTSYGYNAFNNLTSVTQGTQSRSFAYDSLKRLLSATYPESGTITYSYDGGGNLLTKTDARSIVTTMTYDKLNRVQSKSYSDGTPMVSYFYDNETLPCQPTGFSKGASAGRLVAVMSGASGANCLLDEFTGYDLAGRVSRSYQRIDGQDYGTTSLSYNRAGSLLSLTYPSGRVVAHSYDNAARLASLTSSGVGTSGISYTPSGSLASETYGNGLLHSISYNARLQPGEIMLGSTAHPAMTLDLNYSYGVGYGPTADLSHDNGNVLGITGNVASQTIPQSFTYDSLNRLSIATETNGGSTVWQQTFSYDRYGNRAILTGGSPDLTFDSHNRIVGQVYDAAGNVLADGHHTYTYDAENHIISVDNGAEVYVYDGEGHRVKKTLQDNLRMVYGPGGELIAEYDASMPPPPPSAPKKEYIYGEGGLLATVDATYGTQYLTSDHLGTPRVITAGNGTVTSWHDYQPFGEAIGANVGVRAQIYQYGGFDGERQKFTAKERDAETGLDYFGGRYYMSNNGRFNLPDPMPVTKESLVNPQRLNLYIYVNNNPLSSVDPNGADGKGDGGDKVISVFLAFSASDRGEQQAANWQGLSKNGYTVKVYGSSDVVSNSAGAVNSDNFDAALKTSDVVVFVGHGAGNQGSDGAYHQVGIALNDGTKYSKDGENPQGQTFTVDGTEYGKYVGVPMTNSSVICNFSCDSAHAGQYFNDDGKGYTSVSVDSGADGVTTVGTLESAANAFVATYVNTNGNVQQSADAANNAISRDKDVGKADDKKVKPNEGDHVVVKKMGIRD